MEREKVIIKEIRTEREGEFKVEYYLTEEEVDIEGAFGMCMYGIEVVKLADTGAESAYADSLSSDKREVMELIDVMARLTVTPTSLFDVVYDWSAARFGKDFASERHNATA